MTKEEQQLLCADLCARLPYGVKSTVVKLDDNDGSEYYTDCEILGIRRNQLVEFIRIQDDKEIERSEWYDISWFRPYLRPMSSMTFEERSFCLKRGTIGYDEKDKIFDVYPYGLEKTMEVIVFLNAHHFDYRGLIGKGLALEAPKGMYD